MSDNSTLSDGVWQATCEQAVKAVVSLLYYYPRTFDTDAAYSAEATGFVVDAARGIILTNRHVAGPGPFRGRCIFSNQEEADVSVCDLDPIHDFGFLKFDPTTVKRMIVTELPLRPDLLSLGIEVRVIGNDSAAKLNIAAGTISRLNRNAPRYSSPYSDFNTNYIQGSAMTSGGSSGSPVIDIGGHAVALNCGSYEGASVALFLPLDQPLKALRHLQKNEKVPRGTIQVWWTLRAFHECATLGLTDSWVSLVQSKDPEETCMLVAHSVLPAGPGDSKIEEGDILLKADGKIVTLFNDLTDILDANVSKTIEVMVQRGDKEVVVELLVEDLHAITPDRYVLVSGSVFHSLSYVMAQQYRFKVRDSGVFMCHASGVFNFGSNRHLIHSIDGKRTDNLDAFIKVISSIPDGAQIRVTCTSLRDIHKVQHKIVEFDRRLYSSEIATRCFETGLWTMAELPKAPDCSSRPPATKAEVFKLDHPKYPLAAYILNCLVWVKSYSPLPLDGFQADRKSFYGLIVNADLGLILISRDAIHHYFCRCTVIILNSSTTISCEPVYLHPLHNFAILRYDPSLVSTSMPCARLSVVDAKPGDSFLAFRCNDSGSLELSPAVVAGVSRASWSADITTGDRASNIETLTVDTNMTAFSSGCGLMNEDGDIQALWLGGYCINASLVVPIIKQVEAGVMPTVRSIGVYLRNIEMVDAKAMGVSEEWIPRFESSGTRQLYMVSKPYAGHASGFEEGDVILSLDGELMHGAIISKHDLPETLEAVIVRDLQQIAIKIRTFWSEELETSRVVVFCGAVLQPPPLPARQSLSKLHSEVWVGGTLYGSNASRYGISANVFITHVNGNPTPNLDAFLQETKNIPENKYFRVSGVDRWESKFVKTIRTDEHYWPTIQYIRDAGDSQSWRIVREDKEKALLGKL